MIQWFLRHKQEAKPIDPSHMVNSRRAELETAKEILAEIFGVRAAEVHEMIRSRLEEGSGLMTRHEKSIASKSI